MAEDARRLATRFVSLALLAAALGAAGAGIWLMRAGGAGGVAAGIVILLIGLAGALAAFFFLLVPHRLDDLRAMQQEYEAEHGPYKEE